MYRELVQALIRVPFRYPLCLKMEKIMDALALSINVALLEHTCILDRVLKKHSTEKNIEKKHRKKHV